MLTVSRSAGLQCPLDKCRCYEDCRWRHVGRVAHRGWSPLRTEHTARVLTQSESKERSFPHTHARTRAHTHTHTHTHTHRLTDFTDTSSKAFGTAAPVEAHAHSTVLTRCVTLNRLWGRERRGNMEDTPTGIKLNTELLFCCGKRFNPFLNLESRYKQTGPAGPHTGLCLFSKSRLLEGEILV